MLLGEKNNQQSFPSGNLVSDNKQPAEKAMPTRQQWQKMLQEKPTLSTCISSLIHQIEQMSGTVNQAKNPWPVRLQALEKNLILSIHSNKMAPEFYSLYPQISTSLNPHQNKLLFTVEVSIPEPYVQRIRCVESSDLNGTAILHLPPLRLRDYYGREKQKDFKSQKLWISAIKHYFLNITRLLHISTHSGYDSMHMIKPVKISV